MSENQRPNEENENQERGINARNIWSFLAGLLVGGLAGAVVKLLLTPQSGKETRAQIRQKSIELHDQTVKTAEGVVADARGKARQIMDDVHKKTGKLQQLGQDVLDKHKGTLCPKPLIEAGKSVEA